MPETMMQWNIWLCLFWFSFSNALSIPIPSFNPTHISLQLDQNQNISVSLNKPSPTRLNFAFTYRGGKGDYQNDLDALVIEPLPSFSVDGGKVGPVVSQIVPRKPGHIYLGLNETNTPNSTTELEHIYCDILVMHYAWLDILQNVIGWMYFAAWTVSFYPQVYLNWKRKSVVGFNLDFLCLNIVGFLAYSVFNVALYASDYLKREYTSKHPLGVVPVFENDIFFSVHAFAICLLTGVQVLIYERGGQRVSRTCIGILSLIAIYCVINAILCGVNVLSWLTFVYNLSYVKLFVTFIKYIPQAVMNCRRRSTVGWSIGNICLDLTGGVLSILQMFIIAYNYEDWSNVFGSPTKFGLGLFSIAFDVFFMIQHWCLFPHRGNVEVEVTKVDDDPLLESSNGNQSSNLQSTSTTV